MLVQAKVLETLPVNWHSEVVFGQWLTGQAGQASQTSGRWLVGG